MRTWRFWAEVEGTLDLEGGAQVIHARAGSNTSEDEARQEAQRRLERVQRRVAGNRLPRQDDYEVDIREEVLEWFDPGAAITRNRYGAHVLNAERLPMLDVDDPPRRFLDWFRAWTPERRQQRMVDALSALATRPDCQGLGFRLYATAKGFRVILVGRPLEPKDPLMRLLARTLHVDPLFWHLCLRQGCYRARLTPKPYRMKCCSHRVRFPASPEEAAETRAWEQDYLGQASRWATCRFLQTFGQDTGGPLVSLHDQRTGAHSGRNLA